MPIYDADFAAYCAANGLTGDADIQGHIHANLRCKPNTKAHERRWIKELRRLNNARDASKAKYRAALASGAYIPAPTPTLSEIAASGHPDSQQTQAAVRVLAKRAARQALLKPELAPPRDDRQRPSLYHQRTRHDVRSPPPLAAHAAHRP
jgi:hypothetical protein